LREPKRNSPICLIVDCGKQSHKKSLCGGHFWRFKKYGDPMAGGTALGSTLRFINEVAIPYRGDGCLTWPFSDNGVGYGTVQQDGKMQLVTRVICESVHGPAPSPEHEAAHSCGKGHEGCCAPDHLHWATHSENELEKIDHGTHRKGERHPLVKLTEDQVRQIRQLKGTMFQREIAELFGVGRIQISRIHSGERWGHLV